MLNESMSESLNYLDECSKLLDEVNKKVAECRQYALIADECALECELISIQLKEFYEHLRSKSNLFGG